EDDVLAEGFELAAVAVAETFAHTGEQQQRSHAPGDAKHGEEGAQLVRPQGAQGLGENVEEGAHRLPPVGRGGDSRPISIRLLTAAIVSVGPGETRIADRSAEGVVEKGRLR